METLIKKCLWLILLIPFIGVGQDHFYYKFNAGPFDQGKGITQLPDSSFAITGMTDGADAYSSQVYLTLLDSVGNWKWANTFGASGDDIGMRVFYIPNDGFLIAGHTNSTPNGDFDFGVWKTNISGDLIWEKQYGSENWETLHDALLLPTGQIILVGETDGPTTLQKDIFMVCINGIGDTLWTKTIQTPEEDYITSIDTLSATQFVVGGQIGNAGISQGMLMAFDTNGNLIWQKLMDEGGQTNVRDVYVAGNYIFSAGDVWSNGASHSDGFLGKNDLLGGYVLYNGISKSGSYYYSQLVVKDGNIYAIMEFDLPELNPFPYGNDISVIRFAATGLYYNGFNPPFSGANNDEVNQLMITLDNGIAFVGTAGDESHEYSPGTDLMVVKISPTDSVTYDNTQEGLSLLAIKTNENLPQLLVYPNPTIGTIYIPKKAQGAPFELLDMTGKTIDRGSLSKKLSLVGIDKGIYFLKIKIGTKIWSKKIVKR